MSWQLVQAHVARHHGIVSRREALELGLTDGQIARRVASRDLVRVAPSVYRHAAWGLTWHGKARAEALSADGLIGFGSAAAAWMIDGYRPGPIHVVVPEGRQLRRPAATVNRSKQFDLADATVRSRIPVPASPVRCSTSPASCRSSGWRQPSMP